jgi:hypothetical protein
MVTLGRNIVSESNPPVEQQCRPTGRQIIAAIIVVAALVLIFQNTKIGHFQFLWFDFQASVWLWLLVVFGEGGKKATHRVDSAGVNPAPPLTSR